MKKSASVLRALLCFLMAGELCLAADIAMAILGHPLRLYQMAALGLFLTALFFFSRLKGKKWAALPLTVAGLCLAAGLSAFLIWRAFAAGAPYQAVDQGKEALFGGRRALVVVPHEDDDLNLMCGLLEPLTEYGSEVKVVFLSSGDYKENLEAPERVTSAQRIGEALSVLTLSGLPEENVIFLGYGDQWEPYGPHIYNAEPDQPMVSHSGRTRAYATPEHPAYHEGELYTRQNLLNDLVEIISDYRPDTVFACDYDYHVDHRATSLFFEEAMGQVLAKYPDYEPLVLKGFAYSTAYFAVQDFYQPNLGSTANPGSAYIDDTHIYAWADRLRLPVDAAGLSRSLLSTSGFHKTLLYGSQTIRYRAEGIINSDKVFWIRDTASLCYGADSTASSGEAWRLTDFKLNDSNNLLDNSLPCDGTWVPGEGDAQRKAELKLPQSSDIAFLRLYDDPSEESNVLDALIHFDDGSLIHTGALNPMGSATDIPVDKAAVSSFSVQLLETEGDHAGLTEIEAYAQPQDHGLHFIKLQNAAEDFVYDYYIDRSGQEAFTLYTVGAPEELNPENYRVRIEGEGCQAEIQDGKLLVTCPPGKSCLLTVATADGTLSDSVWISNPSPLHNLGQEIEAFVSRYFESIEHCVTYRIARGAYRLLAE